MPINRGKKYVIGKFKQKGQEIIHVAAGKHTHP